MYRRSITPFLRILLALGGVLSISLTGCQGSANGITSQAESGWQTSAAPAASENEYDNVIDGDEAQAIPLAGSRDLPPEAYSRDSITVFFRNDIALTELQEAGIAIQPGPATLAANALLRNDPACEYLAQDIAVQLGLMLTNQVYMGRTRMAAFRIPAGIDIPRLLDELRSSYAEFIVDAAASQLGRACFAPDDPDYLMSSEIGGPLWGLHTMDFGRAWELGTGDVQIMICTLDSGVNMQHEELLGRLIDPAVSFPEVTADIVHHDTSIEDNHGHGTAMAGLVSAAFDNGRSVVGGAPGCSQLPIKITDDYSSDFTIANVIEGGYLARQLGVDILSMSFTIWEASPAVQAMLQDLDDAGMLLLAAAGNDGTESDNYPAGFPEVISVASTDIGDGRSSFSNDGPGVELAAPGRDLRICGNQFNSGALAYSIQFGTSLSTPLVAAAAGLQWSAHPELTTAELRSQLALSGAPSSGFGHVVPRVDIGALLNAYSGALLLPTLTGMIVTGEISLTAQQLEVPQSTRLLLGDEVLAERTEAPWQFAGPSDSRLIGAVPLTLESGSALQPYSDSALIFVDNTAGTYPLLDGAEIENGLLSYYDAGLAQRSVRLALENQFAPDWTEQSVREEGHGKWQRIADDSSGSSKSWYCGMPDSMEYDSSEFDCLLTARIDLMNTSDPVLRFRQHFNVQDSEFGYDRASVLASTDNGASWELLRLVDDSPAWFSGFQPDWRPVELPLADYAGQVLHICFCLQSDSAISGEQTGQPSGWWLDDIYLGNSDQSGMADFDMEEPLPYSLYGTVNGLELIDIKLAESANLLGTRISLDCRPFGVDNGEDLEQAGLGSVPATINIAELLRPNQTAWLLVGGTNSDGIPGRSYLLPLYIFNQPGDVNADMMVDERDALLIRDSVGIGASDPAWRPFLDADLDGQVTELDLSAVGYHWGGSP